MSQTNAVPDPTTTAPRARARGMPEKRRAILDAARAVFGRGGYTRTSVDLIAAEAEVSKRTIYNHFADKEQLFQTVILEGAADVADTQAVIADRHLRKIVDIEQDLLDLALERVKSLDVFAGHWALVRVIESEATHISPEVLEAWLDAGQRQTQRILAGWMAGLADRGFLSIDDPEQAATLFNLLTFISVAQPTFYGAIRLPDDEVRRTVTFGAATFLSLYGTRA